jgi:cytidyltransferase-like protein
MNPRSERKALAPQKLPELAARLSAAGRSAVLLYGTFERLHAGHIRLLQNARSAGDLLIVAVAPDTGADVSPLFNAERRMEMLAAITTVDHVLVLEPRALIEAIDTLRPVAFAVADGSLGTHLERGLNAVSAYGGRLLGDGGDGSLEHLDHIYSELMSTEARAFVSNFRGRYSARTVIGHLKALSDLKVLVLGDTIIDEYHYSRAIGKASKSAAVSVRFRRAEEYAGGALAVANHVASFCSEVHLVTCLGLEDPRTEFVRANLKPNVRASLHMRPDGPTTIKRRFVGVGSLAKFFEISFYNDAPPPQEVQDEMFAAVAELISQVDLVLVADFGHGLMNRPLVELVSEKARFLAVNAQVNSINLGYNLITKYPRADYVSIDEEETRMACQDRFSPLETLIPTLANRLKCRLWTTTRGTRGSLTWRPGAEPFAVPVFSTDIVDTVGAGDAYLSVTALCACRGYPAPLIGFVGNAVGALAVRIVGNRESIEAPDLYRLIHSLLR